MPANQTPQPQSPPEEPVQRIQEDFRQDEGILYVRFRGTIDKSDILNHYQRLAANQYVMHQQGLKAILYDLREVDTNIPFVSLMRTAQQARKNLDFTLMGNTVRVFVMNSSREVGIIQVWMRLSALQIPMRICTTLEQAYKIIERW